MSIVIPARQEARFIGRCLDSIIANDYPEDRLEVLVMDGMSTDRTPDIVADYSRRYPWIRLVANPKMITPAAFNIGVKASRNDLLMILGAHATVAPDYVRRCVDGLLSSGADNVGGAIHTIPQTHSWMSGAIASALSHSFGVGNSVFRKHVTRPQWVDTVYGGCYRRTLFDRLEFDERIIYSEDIEFNLRLRHLGGRILLLPDIVSWYYARSTVGSFWRINIRNGQWAIIPLVLSPVVPMRLRHFVPLIFVSSLLGSFVLTVLGHGLGLAALMTIVAAYLTDSLIAAIDITLRRRDAAYLLKMPFAFAVLHFGYGIGSIMGIARIVRMREFWDKLALLPSRFPRLRPQR